MTEYTMRPHTREELAGVIREAMLVARNNMGTDWNAVQKIVNNVVDRVENVIRSDVEIIDELGQPVAGPRPALAGDFVKPSL